MMKKYNWFYYFMLFFSSLMFLFMNNYFSLWMMMELNLTLFLVLMVLSDYNVMDKMMKYYLLNSFSSLMFLYAISFLLMYLNLLSIFIINLSMLAKLGVVPFHFWFINLMAELKWFLCLILCTWQKLMPMIMLNFFFFNILMIFILFSGIMSMVWGFSQIMLKKIIAYSSINHIGWMLILLKFSFKLWVFYFFSYFLMNYCIILLFHKMSMNLMMDLNLMMLKKKFNMNWILMFMFMSLSGLPLFYGFALKWYSLMYMSFYNFWFFILILVMFSLLFMYLYIRLFFNYMMINLMKFKFFYYWKFDYSMMQLILMILFSLNLSVFFMWVLY